jgi:hypothetical protein
MTQRPGLLAASLLLLHACAAPTSERAEIAPAVLWRAVPASASAAADPWSLLASAPEATPLVTAAAPAPQGPGRRFKPQTSLGSTRLMLNQQQLDEDYWRPTSKHLNFGLETSFERYGDWLGGEGGFFFTMEDDEGVYVIPGQGNTKITIDMLMVEIYGGVHRTFLREGPLRPYVGAGVSVFYIDADQVIKPTFGRRLSDSEDEFALGVYAHGGVSLQLGRNFQIGVDARFLESTSVDVLSGPEGDLGYRQLSIFLGYGG